MENYCSLDSEKLGPQVEAAELHEVLDETGVDGNGAGLGGVLGLPEHRDNVIQT